MNHNCYTPDWNFIDDISINLLEEGIGNFDVLQKALPSIVLSKIDQTNKEFTVERLMKMFRIAQLQIEYILKTQTELVKEIESLKDRLKLIHLENSQLKKQLISDPEAVNSLFKCDCCDKLFLHSTFLYNHMKRQHKNETHKDSE